MLNEDTGYVHRSDQVRWVDGAREAVRWLNDAGYFVFIVTNQAGVARGYYSEDHVADLHDWMNAGTGPRAAPISMPSSTVPITPRAPSSATGSSPTCASPGPA